MKLNTKKIRNRFFKKSFSVGHHNNRYSWQHLMLLILNCIKGLESIEGGSNSPSAQTVRDRLQLISGWEAEFHDSAAKIAMFAVRKFSRLRWYISIDETHTPFFGDREKLNKELVRKGGGGCVHGYKADVKGATGSFCFVVISLCCARIRIPLAVRMVKVGDRYCSWLSQELESALSIAPRSVILADRGFGKAVWFLYILEGTGADYVVRMPLRKKESKNKARNGKRHFQQWYGKESKNGKILIDIFIARDSQDREYVLVSNIKGKRPSLLLSSYMHRWDIENIFKDADRVELKTSSRNPMMRLFCVVTSLFIFALWQVERIIDKIFCSLRNFVKKLLNRLCFALKCVISPLGEIILPT